MAELFGEEEGCVLGASTTWHSHEPSIKLSNTTGQGSGQHLCFCFLSQSAPAYGTSWSVRMPTSKTTKGPLKVAKPTEPIAQREATVPTTVDG
jgi:hypothetical protein